MFVCLSSLVARNPSLKGISGMSRVRITTRAYNMQYPLPTELSPHDKFKLFLYKL